MRNLKGRTLQELGFNSKLVHIGYPVDVGFRTTDMALRLGRDVANSFTSVNIALPMSPTRSVADRRKHSTTFTAVDFNSANLISALRFIGRHDNHIIYFDRFGTSYMSHSTLARQVDLLMLIQESDLRRPIQ